MEFVGILVVMYAGCQYLDGGLSNVILVDGWQSRVRPRREALSFSSIIDVHRHKQKSDIVAMVAVNLFGVCLEIGSVVLLLYLY